VARERIFGSALSFHGGAASSKVKLAAGGRTRLREHAGDDRRCQGHGENEPADDPNPSLHGSPLSSECVDQTAPTAYKYRLIDHSGPLSLGQVLNRGIVLAPLVASAALSYARSGMAVGDAMTVRVVTVRPKASVQEAITRMLEENIGSVAVCDGPRLVGIFTERDVLRAAGEGSLFGEVAVEDVMTRRPVTVSPEDDIVAAAELMAAKRIRHLPVCEGEFLVGMIGIRDVLRRVVEQASERDEGARDTARALSRARRVTTHRDRRPAVVSSARAPVRFGPRRLRPRAPCDCARGDARRRDPQRSRRARRSGRRRPVPVAARLRLPADDRFVTT
jgi:CBS domain-containing protein